MTTPTVAAIVDAPTITAGPVACHWCGSLIWSAGELSIVYQRCTYDSEAAEATDYDSGDISCGLRFDVDYATCAECGREPGRVNRRRLAGHAWDVLSPFDHLADAAEAVRDLLANVDDPRAAALVAAVDALPRFETGPSAGRLIHLPR